MQNWTSTGVAGKTNGVVSISYQSKRHSSRRGGIDPPLQPPMQQARLSKPPAMLQLPELRRLVVFLGGSSGGDDGGKYFLLNGGAENLA